jgi:hypothetical protein
MNTAAQSTPSDVHAPSSKTFVDTLVELGSSWAAYGLKVGKMALVHSAETLGKTAETLDTLAVAMEKKAGQAKAEEAPKDEAATAAAPKADSADPTIAAA